MNDVDETIAYHEHSKHFLDRFAEYMGFFDWDNRPEVYRDYEGSERIDLPLAADSVQITYNDLYKSEPDVRHAAGLDTLGCLFELGMGISAWKQWGERSGTVRCDPSSGNLHPTEGYLISPGNIGSVPAGVYHYHPHEHSLETRCVLTDADTAAVQALLPNNSFLIGLSSIYWRESWKYGVRAFRYCQHDLGHVIGSIRYSAAVLGWTCRILDLDSATTNGIIGLDREGFIPEEGEHGETLLIVSPEARPDPNDIDAVAFAKVLSAASKNGAWQGSPKPLSVGHHPWPRIEEAARLTKVPETTARAELPPPAPLLNGVQGTELPAPTLIRQRRSALEFDGESTLDSAAFFLMLDRLIVRPDVAPFDALDWAPTIDLAMFVHRVAGVEPGLYYFHRSAVPLAALQVATKPDFAWTRVAAAPEHLGLYLLEAGDFGEQAETVSCRQSIAATGAFSLGMVAEFAGSLERHGANFYRRLFWESGVIGQELYLEAEAAGIRGTGIGCFFDDPVHEVFGFSDNTFQSLYHFTMGSPLEDERILPVGPYDHLEGRPQVSFSTGM